jgi:hypothetical protein
MTGPSRGILRLALPLAGALIIAVGLAGSGGGPALTLVKHVKPSPTPTPAPSPTPAPTPTPSPSPSPSPSPGGTHFSQADIDSAVAAPLIGFAAPTSSAPRPGTNPTNVGESKVLYYLALVNRLQPGATATSGVSVQSALLAQVRNLVAGGHEPDADGGLEGWAHNGVAQALLLLKSTPATWSLLSSGDQGKVSLLEAAMGYGGNYTYNDANNFSSGICGFGNFAKTNNPNYRDGYVDVELAAIQFFGGGAAWDSMLTSFDDATVASQLNAAGLTNAGGCFAQVGAAANSAIAVPFVYGGHPSSDLIGIYGSIEGFSFDKTAVSTVTGVSNGQTVTASIADGTTSPYDGQCCMEREFDSSDSGGLRSSALYAFEGWMNLLSARASMTVLGTWNCGTPQIDSTFEIGTADLMYKLLHGYISWAASQQGILVNETSPSTDGPGIKGYAYDKDIYNSYIAQQPC